MFDEMRYCDAQLRTNLLLESDMGDDRLGFSRPRRRSLTPQQTSNRIANTLEQGGISEEGYPTILIRESEPYVMTVQEVELLKWAKARFAEEDNGVVVMLGLEAYLLRNSLSMPFKFLSTTQDNDLRKKARHLNVSLATRTVDTVKAP